MKSDIQAETRSANCGKNNTPKDMAGDKFTQNAGTKSRSGEVDYTKRDYETNKVKRIK
jgi:hypothetical protein